MYKPFHVFDDLAKKFDRFVLSYSGGKDSTAVAILLYQWARERRPGIDVVVLHEDTFSEINAMEAWAMDFLNRYVDKMKDYVNISLDIVTPPAVDTFYWRVFVFGYPAPTFNFRWCVELLKVRPAKTALEKYGNAVFITGLRDSESAARATAMRKRFGACTPGSCLGAFLSTGDMTKAAPIRNWSEEDVWRFLAVQRDFDVSPLFSLYRVENYKGSVRYGCWHCTLTRIQPGLYLSDKLLYVKALRMIYRAVSNMTKYRTTKSWGYSRWGPLTAEARSLLYHLIPIAEKLSGHRFYGLDSAKINGTSLRQIFYEFDDAELDAVVKKMGRLDRWVGASKLRAQPKKDVEVFDIVANMDVTGLVLEKTKELYEYI
ncbi:MAG: phosphoadenosine phosphosulfate reductase family protein [Pyrobaculum sp.]